jgi:HAD superfamily hydrolase (TIGR01509 family)
LLLGKIKSEGKKIGVATNSIKQTAEFMLQYAGVSQFLDTLVTNQDVSKPKPDPEIYISAAANLGLEPKECLVFEDNENGINAAKTAGCHVVQVASPSEVNLSQYFRALERIEAN